MAASVTITDIAFWISIGVTLTFFVAADHLWKPVFFRRCLAAAILIFLFGTIGEIFQFAGMPLIDARPGMAAVVSGAPLIFLLWFDLLRFGYKRLFQTEPCITGRTTWIGSVPSDMSGWASKDGRQKKYSSDRRVTFADLVFSALHALGPAFTILGLLSLV